MWETFPHQKPAALLGLAQKEGFCKGRVTVADAKGVDVAVSEAAAQLRIAFGKEMMGSIWGPATLKSSATLLLIASDKTWMKKRIHQASGGGKIVKGQTIVLSGSSQKWAVI